MAAGRRCPAAFAVIALAHGLAVACLPPDRQERTARADAYRYVVAPRGVRSEGPPEMSASTQPLGRAVSLAPPTNQMQITLAAGALPTRRGEKGVRVTLD